MKPSDPPPSQLQPPDFSPVECAFFEEGVALDAAALAEAAELEKLASAAPPRPAGKLARIWQMVRRLWAALQTSRRCSVGEP